MRSLLLTTTAFLFLAACTAKDPDPGPGEQPPPAEPATYHRDIRAMLEASCTTCHVAGGIGPYALDTYESAKQFAGIALLAVESGRMPPWTASPDCRHYEGERLLTVEQKAALRSWVENGTLEGDPADYKPITTTPSSLTEVGPPTLVLTPVESYTPRTERPDDYRCFPLPHQFTEETYLKMTNVIPEHPELVHHVIIYLVQPQFVPQLERLDAAESGEGYTCFGGPGTSSPQNIGAWVPGSEPNMLADGVAIRIPAGARLVMQMHYNTLASATKPEKTQLEMWLSEEQPQFLINVQPFPHLGIELPAGEANVHESRLFTNNTDATWIAGAVAPHMHLLGNRISMTAIRNGAEECIIDIPNWDFNWQQSYRFKDGATVQIAPGESVRVDCWYDNSAANQPIVNGMQLAPRTVHWGEGTLDEMCLVFLAMVEPFAPLPEPGAVCPDFQTCYDNCIQGGLTPRSGCAMQCAQDSGEACSQCVGGGIGQCVIDVCPKAIGDLVECADSCRSRPDANNCVRTECLAALFAFDDCAAPKIIANECDLYASGCGADL